jgi:hypothetical protein
MPTRFLYSSDRKEFTELDEVHFEPPSRSGQRIVCASLVQLPPEFNSYLFTSTGEMHFLLVEKFVARIVADSNMGVVCRAVITETPNLEPDEIGQIQELFSAFDATGGSKRSVYVRPPQDARPISP